MQRLITGEKIVFSFGGMSYMSYELARSPSESQKCDRNNILGIVYC